VRQLCGEIMEEKGLLSGVTATVLAPFVDGWEKLLCWLIVAIVLILADLIFGIKAAKTRGDHIRRSKAWRRSINKLVDYICWIAIAWVIGAEFSSPFNMPLLPLIVMAAVYGIELQSIIDNYLEYKNVKKRFSLFKLVTGLLKKSELKDSIEDKK
jgi:uncharacterized membrane-anchored protein